MCGGIGGIELIFAAHGGKQEFALLFGFLAVDLPIFPSFCVKGVFVPGRGFIRVDVGVEDGFGGGGCDVGIRDGKRGLGAFSQFLSVIKMLMCLVRPGALL